MRRCRVRIRGGSAESLPAPPLRLQAFHESPDRPPRTVPPRRLTPIEVTTAAIVTPAPRLVKKPMSPKTRDIAAAFGRRSNRRTRRVVLQAEIGDRVVGCDPSPPRKTRGFLAVDKSSQFSEGTTVSAKSRRARVSHGHDAEARATGGGPGGLVSKALACSSRAYQKIVDTRTTRALAKQEILSDRGRGSTSMELNLRS